jgi:hypothetical protein
MLGQTEVLSSRLKNPTDIDHVRSLVAPDVTYGAGAAVCAQVGELPKAARVRSIDAAGIRNSPA